MGRHRDTGGDKGHVMTEAETGVMLSHPQGQLEPSVAGRCRKDNPADPVASDFRPPHLGDGKCWLL